MNPGDRDFEWIVEQVRHYYAADAIYLFGSTATKPRPGGDIDLVIVGPNRLPRPRRGRHVAAALQAYPSKFDLLFYTAEELEDETSDPASFISTALTGARKLYGP